MSSLGQKGSQKPPRPRQEADAYFTPDALARAICGRLATLRPATVVEPSAGQGAFVKAARTQWPSATVLAGDINPAFPPALKASGAHGVFVWDWLDPGLCLRVPPQAHPMLILGNPPFGELVEHVEASLARLERGDYLAFLTRLSFLGTQERAANAVLWKDLAKIIPLAERPSFTGGSGDYSEYMVCLWVKGLGGNAVLDPPPVVENVTNARQSTLVSDSNPPACLWPPPPHTSAILATSGPSGLDRSE